MYSIHTLKWKTSNYWNEMRSLSGSLCESTNQSQWVWFVFWSWHCVILNSCWSYYLCSLLLVCGCENIVFIQHFVNLLYICRYSIRRKIFKISINFLISQKYVKFMCWVKKSNSFWGSLSPKNRVNDISRLSYVQCSTVKKWVRVLIKFPMWQSCLWIFSSTDN